MPLLVIAIGIAALLILILGFRINAFIALILVSLGVGMGVGMSPLESVDAIQKGVGSTLGSLALILGFGAMLGNLIAESGAAQVISRRLINGFGIKYIPWAMVLTGFIVGVPMFYTVAFLVVIPIIFAVSEETKLPVLYIGLPIIASLSVTHGFLPPHPAPTAIVEFYGADMQMTLLYGLVLAVPTVILAGVIFGKTFRNFSTEIPSHLFKKREIPGNQLPSFGVSVFTALIPVLLMGLAAVSKLTLPKENLLNQVLQFTGDPIIALLLAVLIAIWTLGLQSGRSLRETMESMTDAVKPVAIIMLIIAGGGAFKQVLVDSGTSAYIVDAMQHVNLSPLVMAWCVAAALRIALGSATVAALTAAGIVQPLVATGTVNAELLVLATGAGSLTFSQVNDTGFWLFKEYFNLSIVETLKSWTAMETIVSIAGLAGCLVLDAII